MQARRNCRQKIILRNLIKVLLRLAALCWLEGWRRFQQAFWGFRMRPEGLIKTILAAAACLLLTTTVFADDWVAERLRGRVVVLNEGQWEPLSLGDVVSDDRPVRTMLSGRVVFRRGAETISIGGNTQISIHDASGRRMTTVTQSFGTVTIEAERQQVQHFSVQTPFLAAVVKGTQFTVVSGKKGARVAVDRGMVQVRDTMHSVMTDVPAGQNAKVGPGQMLTVSGPGEKSPMVTFEGVPVTDMGAYVEFLDQGGTPGSSDAPGLEIAAGVSNAGGNGNGVGVSAGVGGNNGVGVGVGNGNGNGNGNGVGVGVGNGNGVNVNAGGLRLGLGLGGGRNKNKDDEDDDDEDEDDDD
jgi:FecR protein